MNERYILELNKEELETLRDAVRFADQMTGDGTAAAPTYKLRGKLAGLRPVDSKLKESGG